MSDDFYTMVDSGDPAPDNEHITGVREERAEGEQTTTQAPRASPSMTTCCRHRG